MFKRFLFLVAGLVPGLAMLSAHWFPWRTVLARDLHRAEAYTYGVGWIVGVAGGCMRLAERTDTQLSPPECARLLEVSALSAGICTVLAYAIDGWTQERKENFVRRAINQEARHGEIRRKP